MRPRPCAVTWARSTSTPPQAATRIRCEAGSRAVAAPMPLPAPVTGATWPVVVVMGLCLLLFVVDPRPGRRQGVVGVGGEGATAPYRTVSTVARGRSATDRSSSRGNREVSSRSGATRVISVSSSGGAKSTPHRCPSLHSSPSRRQTTVATRCSTYRRNIASAAQSVGHRPYARSSRPRRAIRR
jgi:hypothetical protein